jgi:3-deoxy-D-manno-octulosonic-acid transferase
MLLIYKIAINLIVFISPVIVLFRLFKKKEDPLRFKEKFCFFTKKKSKGKLIWFHGASVGEILSVIPLIEKLEKNKKINQILLTSNTLSSSKIISNLKLKKTIHQFFPIDTNYHTQKFLNYWKPSIVIFIDSEIWPNMITNIKKKSIPLILLNARITKKSFKKWKMFSSSTKELFQKFDICFSSSIQSKKYLQSLGAETIKYIGNLKFSQTEKNEDFLNKNLKKYFLSKKIWCAASTHNTEEKFCLIAHKKLKKRHKNLLTIIIPRHIDRTKSIIEEVKNLNLKVHTHDSKKKISNDTDVYLVNSYGKTKSFFKICKTVFLGGSLIKHGGQNPLEAARYGCKILHGPNVSNFQEIYSLLNKYNVSNQITNLNGITNNVDKLFNNKTNSSNIKNKIKGLGDKILNSTLKEVNFFIKKNETKKT